MEKIQLQSAEGCFAASGSPTVDLYFCSVDWAIIKIEIIFYFKRNSIINSTAVIFFNLFLKIETLCQQKIK